MGIFNTNSTSSEKVSLEQVLEEIQNLRKEIADLKEVVDKSNSYMKSAFSNVIDNQIKIDKGLSRYSDSYWDPTHQNVFNMYNSYDRDIREIKRKLNI